MRLCPPEAAMLCVSTAGLNLDVAFKVMSGTAWQGKGGHLRPGLAMLKESSSLPPSWWTGIERSAQLRYADRRRSENGAPLKYGDCSRKLLRRRQVIRRKVRRQDWSADANQVSPAG